ncbi:MAG: hypothetical protein ABL901_13465 [Hyphomicrobiaceae bacterium]
MNIRPAVTIALIAFASPAGASDEFKIPPEVTPSMRAACESDVRRLCLSSNSTVDSVRSCVLSKFMRLGKRCQVEIASAGLAP